MSISAVNNYFHPPHRNHPFWNESAWFSIADPKNGLCGFAYVNHRPNMGFSIGGIALWNSKGAEPYNCSYYDWTINQLPADAQMFDFELENSFRIKTLQPLSSYEIGYRGGGLGYVGDYIELDFIWNSVAPLKSLELSADAKGWMGEHYEQIGRIKGTLRIRGEQFEIDSFSIRDHSWGPRRPKTTARSSFAWSIASPNHAFCVWTGQDCAHGDDPVEGTTELLRHGWYLKDGVLSDLTAAERRATRRPDGFHNEVNIVGQDALGRDLVAVGDVGPRLNFTGYPEMMISWGMTRWSYDGIEAWGEEHDTFPIQIARRFLRDRWKAGA